MISGMGLLRTSFGASFGIVAGANWTSKITGLVKSSLGDGGVLAASAAANVHDRPTRVVSRIIWMDLIMVIFW
ncbi:hypothetical protein LBMAG53_17610 [Planctomycetota bacterium]|nr:hypothetical protein LBMAG53_17610 [Planctomycetota bacterium]